jgi:large subunit ribosomal protein L23
MGFILEEVIKRPIITEKSSNQASLGKYTFEVPTWATKDHVKEAFKKFFPELNVTKVNMAKVFGHSKRTKKGIKAPRDSKKAIVTVEGGKIDYFPEI